MCTLCSVHVLSGAIIFGSDQEVREVMRAVRRNNATGMFSWIGSDGWSARNLVSDGNEPEVSVCNVHYPRMREQCVRVNGPNILLIWITCACRLANSHRCRFVRYTLLIRTIHQTGPKKKKKRDKMI